MRGTQLVVLLALMAGCQSGASPASTAGVDASSPRPPGNATSTQVPPPATPSERWAGSWFIDQPGHAEYEAAIYELAADGTLRSIRQHSSIAQVPLDRPMVGFVERRERGMRCEFGTKWRAPTDKRLEILGSCNDGHSRWIQLDDRFEVVGVDGEAGWEHPRNVWWRWLKCESATCEKESKGAFD